MLSQKNTMEKAVFSFEEVTYFRISQYFILLKSLPADTGFLLGNKDWNQDGDSH